MCAPSHVRFSSSRAEDILTESRGLSFFFMSVIMTKSLAVLPPGKERHGSLKRGSQNIP